jgi:hypothetical protein
MTIAGTALAAIAILAAAFESPRVAAVFGAAPYWLVAHTGYAGGTSRLQLKMSLSGNTGPYFGASGWADFKNRA